MDTLNSVLALDVVLSFELNFLSTFIELDSLSIFFVLMPGLHGGFEKSVAEIMEMTKNDLK